MTTTADVRYPNVEVELTGREGNAMAIIARVRSALRRAGVPEREITEFSTNAMARDDDHVLATCERWVTVS